MFEFGIFSTMHCNGESILRFRVSKVKSTFLYLHGLHRLIEIDFPYNLSGRKFLLFHTVCVQSTTKLPKTYPYYELRMLQWYLVLYHIWYLLKLQSWTRVVLQVC